MFIRFPKVQHDSTTQPTNVRASSITGVEPRTIPSPTGEIEGAKVYTEKGMFKTTVSEKTVLRAIAAAEHGNVEVTTGSTIVAEFDITEDEKVSA
jgi:hypothetical protein